MKKFISLMILPIFLITLAVPLFASVDISLAWDPNSEDDLAGYRIYHRTDVNPLYDYSLPIFEVNILDLQDLADKNFTPGSPLCTIMLLDGSIDHHFVARAFDTSGNESADSDPVTYNPPQNQTPGIIENIRKVA